MPDVTSLDQPGLDAPGSGLIETAPMGPDRWDDLVGLFGRSGADGGCWCMYFRLRGRDWQLGDSNGNRSSLLALVDQGAPTGLLAYRDGVAVGWAGLGPREGFTRLEHSRLLGRVDDLAVWSLVCFFVARRARRTGVARALLQAAVAHARARGAPALEAYPSRPGARAAANAYYRGTHDLFAAAGFVVVRHVEAEGSSAEQWVMRLSLVPGE